MVTSAVSKRGQYMAVATFCLCILLLLALWEWPGLNIFQGDSRSWQSETSSYMNKEEVDFLDDQCGCVWRIGCPKFRWQVNFTSPRYRCSYEPMTETLLNQCLGKRHEHRNRRLRLRIVGSVREAFFTDYIRQRLGASAVRETCSLIRTEPTAKKFGTPDEKHAKILAKDGGETCYMDYETAHVQLQYKLLGLLSDDIFSYVDEVNNDCLAEGCAGDILIISGGTAELLNSTLIDSFEGVRKFQRRFRVLLPRLIDLVTSHQMEVVWKVHEPVTDELIPEGSMVRNDLLQEYNALIMEQTLRTPLKTWTSHMIMKLHHIEDCSEITDDSFVNGDPWRCEEEWVAGDRAHDEYFDTVFNKVCDKMVPMPENSCCSV